MDRLSPFRKTQDLTPEMTDEVDDQSQAFEGVLAGKVTPTGLNVAEVGVALRERTKPLKRAIVNLDGNLFTRIVQRLPAQFDALNSETFESAEYAADAYADVIRSIYTDVISEHFTASRDALDEALEPGKKAHGLMEAPWKKDPKQMPNPRIYLDWVGLLTTQVETGSTDLIIYDEFAKGDDYEGEDPYLPIEEYGRTWLDRGGRFVAGLGGSLATAVAEGLARDALEKNAPKYILPKIKTELKDDALFGQLESGLTVVVTQLGSFPLETMTLFLNTVNASFKALKGQTPPAAEAVYGVAAVGALRVAIADALEKDLAEVKETDPEHMHLTAMRDIFAAVPDGKVITPAWAEALKDYLDTSQAPPFAGFEEFIEIKKLSEDDFYTDPFESLKPAPAPSPAEETAKKTPAEEKEKTDGDEEKPPPGSPDHPVVARAEVDAFLVLETNGVRIWRDLAVETTIDGTEYITYKFRGPEARKPLNDFASLDGIVLWKESLDTAAYESGKIDIGKEMAHAFELAGGWGKGGVVAALGVLLTLAFKNLGGFFDFFTGGKDKKGQKEKKEKKGYKDVAELFKNRFGLDIKDDGEAKAAWEGVEPIRMYALNLFVTTPEDPAIAAADKAALEALKGKMGPEKWALFIKDILDTDLGGKTGREQFGNDPDNEMKIERFVKQNCKKNWPAS